MDREARVQEHKLTRTQALGYQLLVDKLKQQERVVNMLRQQLNEFLSECLRESGHKPGPDWQLDNKTMTLYLPGTSESSKPNEPDQTKE